ncbi:hypothetical protein [Flavobacterium sp. JAS]|uniref:hypothetical protein n=1 Tax=Flavobacterium sp. JAS TaxID=2897329 RepID=UPI001E3A2A9D|nr:hypothetical protein [Flavobacterium sp. JAS]MCD0472348.1 hypothetical protein [Flavobacterium sp. JAS]
MSTIECTITQNQRSRALIPMLILTSLLFILGFLIWLNGPLIPFFKLATSSQAFFVAFAFYIAYLVMAIPWSW